MPFISSMGGFHGYGRGPGPVSVSSPFGVYVVGTYGGADANIYDANGDTCSGIVANIGNDSDCFIVKYDKNGKQIWRTRIGESGTDTMGGIAVGKSGNVYVVGKYRSTITDLRIYDANGTTQSGTLIKTDGNDDVFIIKYDTNGKQVWRTRMAQGGSTDMAYGVALDDSENVYVTGEYQGTINIYNANGGTSTCSGSLSPIGATDCFVVKYNSNGVQLWRTRIGGSSSFDIGRSIAVDNAGNVYICGRYSSGAIINIYDANGDTLSGTVPNSVGTDCFIVKYDTNGIQQWRTRISGTRQEDIYGIALDGSGNLYVTGEYRSTTLNFYDANGDTCSGTLTNPTVDVQDCFIAKYDTNGVQLWRTRISGTNTDYGNGIDVDGSGNVYVVGQYATNPVNIYDANGTSCSGILSTDGNFDCFIVKYDTNGNQIWRTHIGGTSSDPGVAVSVDGSGNVYVTGSYQSTTINIYDANGTTCTGTLLNTCGLGTTTDCFIAMYDTNGIQQWRTRIGGTRSDGGRSIAVL